MPQFRKYVIGAAVLAMTLAGMAQAQDVATVGRDILNQHKEAVVTVRLVISQQFSMPGSGSQKQESRQEITGTVLDPSGLTVVSLSETDPSSVLRRMLGARSREMQFESTVTDAKIIRSDNSEVPAKIVLRDRDQDLTFLRPIQAPETPFVAVDMTQTAQPQLLDQVVILSRLGRVASRTYGAAVDRIQAVIDRPRTFYVPVGADPSGGLGSPVYALDGKLVGMTLLRTVEVEGGGGNAMQQGTLVIIVPAADIQESAAQAPSVEEAMKQEAQQPPAEQAPANPEGAAPPEPAPDAPAPEAPPAAPAPAPAPAEPAPMTPEQPPAVPPVPTPEPGTTPEPPAPSQTSTPAQ